ncbi:MAG: arylsulfotransferase family protein [Acidimicrobiales bacterium]
MPIGPMSSGVRRERARGARSVGGGRSRRARCWRSALGATAIAGGSLLAVPSVAGAQSSAQTSAPIGAYTSAGTWSFVSAPTLHPPKLHTDVDPKTGKLAKGDFLLANFPNVDKPGPMDGQSGPLILNGHLQPVWFEPVPTDVVAMDLKQQTYDGKPALSWWQGVVSKTGATISGTVVVVNDHYKKVATVTGADGWVISPHEVAISGHDAWVTAYKSLTDVDFSADGGSASGTLYDFAVQEYDLKTGTLVYSWDAYKHVAPSASYQAPPASPTVPWDAYHGNSIQLVGKDEFLVSMRDTWAAYLVNIKSGDIVWTLGGKHSTFTVPSNTHFEWQHHVTLSPDDTLTVFDDDCCEISPTGTLAAPGGPSKGLVLKLDTKKHSVALVHRYTHGSDFDAAFTGSTQLLSNGDVLVGWGSQPYFSEFTKGGKMLLDAELPGKDLSYRALLTNTWVGKPDGRPTGAARKAHGKDTVYASWNGATQVAAWRVLAGSTVDHLKSVAKKAMGGFETAIHLKRTYKQLKIQALDANGKVIGTSEAFMVPTPGFY